MLASLEDAPLEDRLLVYEPKYDGIRAIAEISPGGPIRLWSRLGNEKTSQFPEVVAALARWAQRQKQPSVLDGEIVALDSDGRPTGFQQLQGRIHSHGSSRRPGHLRSRPPTSSSMLLRDGDRDLRDLPLLERRAGRRAPLQGES